MIADLPKQLSLVTIVTAAYRPTDDLLRLGALIKGQIHSAVEWIVVDDGSGPSSDGIFRKLKGLEIDGLRVIRLSQNGGQATARNQGIQHAKGAYIKFVDADDEIAPDHLQCLFSRSINLKNKLAIAFAPTRHIWIDTGSSCINKTFRNLGSNHLLQLERILVAPFLSHCGPLFCTNLLRELGGYESTLVTDEDGDLLIRILQAGWHFEAVENCYYDYRHQKEANRVSQDDSLAKYEARRRVCERVLEHYQNAGAPVPKGVAHALCQRIDALALKAFRQHPKYSQSMLELARSILPNPPWSGRPTERLVRKLCGIRTMLMIRDGYQRIRL